MITDNDTRGWIMSSVSGAACILGSGIICIDYLVRLIPSKRNFRIQDSSVFLASSLSLSFGVMLFSALYSMLPSSRNYLIKSGLPEGAAAWILLAGFMVGFAGIQVISRFLHHYIPSHVVDCDHNHGDETHNHFAQSRNQSNLDCSGSPPNSQHTTIATDVAVESTPLLSESDTTNGKRLVSPSFADFNRTNRPRTESTNAIRRSSMAEVQRRVMSFVKDTKANCDTGGPCYGYSDPCGQECFKHVVSRSNMNSRSSTFLRTATTDGVGHQNSSCEHDTVEPLRGRSRGSTRVSHAHSRGSSLIPVSESLGVDQDEDIEAQHHHHVPENAFMSIGLQTSIAIALHKLPEGFITYATNHANPTLGFSVFMALFVHNITEGFAMALPLYLALKSRTKAMVWASLLGGASQPLGAGIAAAWFKLAGREGHAPGTAVYGVMFAVTAGIMTSVALQLFVESLSLNHNRNLCIAFGFIGMVLMGCSNALTS